MTYVVCYCARRHSVIYSFLSTCLIMMFVNLVLWLQISIAEAGGVLACIMDSGNINVYDMEVVFKRILAEQLLEKKERANLETGTIAKQSHTQVVLTICN